MSRVSPDHDQETVILLHGILGRPLLMKKIEGGLRDAGYRVINWGYPGPGRTIEEHAASLDQFVQTLGPAREIHFVGFSLGSIIVRYYLTRYSPKNTGRFVMIAPPNHGSEKADALYQYRWFRLLYGDKAITELFASNRRFFDGLGIPPVEFGIIAGGRCDASGFSDILAGDDDGAVSVESARLEGARDFMVLRHRHVGLLFAPETSQNVVSFLKSGRFDHGVDNACRAGGRPLPNDANE